MTEEKLAARLGLRPTWQMRLVWWRLLVIARWWPQQLEWQNRWMARYQQLGEAAADQMNNADSQIGLILLSAGVYRDLSCLVPAYEQRWREALSDAFIYADNMGLDEEICQAIGRLRFG
ncbi:MAG TPA: hypothetical protein VLI05_05325 [Candidatus Saccharimonadia bacterium]|nr:hypothetical protein [Candidatus Saccharimonadia bacterium]